MPGVSYPHFNSESGSDGDTGKGVAAEEEEEAEDMQRKGTRGRTAALRVCDRAAAGATATALFTIRVSMMEARLGRWIAATNSKQH